MRFEFKTLFNTKIVRREYAVTFAPPLSSPSKYLGYIRYSPHLGRGSLLPNSNIDSHPFVDKVLTFDTSSSVRSTLDLSTKGIVIAIRVRQ